MTTIYIRHAKPGQTIHVDSMDITYKADRRGAERIKARTNPYWGPSIIKWGCFRDDQKVNHKGEES